MITCGIRFQISHTEPITEDFCIKSNYSLRAEVAKHGGQKPPFWRILCIRLSTRFSRMEMREGN